MIVNTQIAPAGASVQRATNFASQQTEAAGPRETFSFSGGEMAISTKNALVTAGTCFLIQGLNHSGILPGGPLGWLAGAAVFAVTKGVYHGIQEVKANEKNGKPYSNGDSFKLGFSHYAKSNIFGGIFHSGLQGALASVPGGILIGPAVSGAITKFTGF